MGITEASETPEFAAFLRSQRTTAEAEAWAAEKAHDADDIPAEDRWSALAH